MHQGNGISYNPKVNYIVTGQLKNFQPMVKEVVAKQVKTLQTKGQGNGGNAIEERTTRRSRDSCYKSREELFNPKSTNIVVMPLEYLQSNNEGHCNKAIEELTSQRSMTL